ncbi:MAG: glycosyltransferase [Helicobacteraceae bacterium]|jgi:glycosyltransferase involved in cell wall biosynthesis|nr:glycosyltransferase [Helicobacteraceae bacterium]
MTSAPQVSIIIPTYKRQNLLSRAIRSALNQTYKNIEILVCDDEKSAETKTIVASFADDRLRYLENARTKGACGARNTGIYAALGEYCVFLDDDDEILPDAVESFLALNASQYAFAYAWNNRIYENGKVRRSNNPPNINFEKLAKEGQNIASAMIFVSKKNLTMIEGYDETLSACQDYDLCLRLAKRFGTAKLIEKTLFNYYSARGYNRISNNVVKKYRGMRKVALKHTRNFSRQDRAKYLYKTRKYLYGEHLGRAFAWLSAKEALKELRHKIKRTIRRALNLKIK